MRLMVSLCGWKSRGHQGAVMSVSRDETDVEIDRRWTFILYRVAAPLLTLAIVIVAMS